jgi:uncharacterized short protein YbdD (DUF466 family)
MTPISRWLGQLWQGLRQASGDDAYERYLAHWHAYHACERDHPMDRKTFFKAEQERKWNGIRRCC